MLFLLFILPIIGLAGALQVPLARWNRRFQRMSMGTTTFAANCAVMINGMPGPMAVEVAEACTRRNITIIDVGFTGPATKQSTISLSSGITISLEKGPGISSTATSTLQHMMEKYPHLIVIDYTHPSAAVKNVRAYVETSVDFVMGTTGFDTQTVIDIFNTGSNYAVIAPNMAKQIVAVQYAVQETARRFPGSFADYHLEVKESHQATKADTSGTAKVLVASLSQLTGSPFPVEEIQRIREESAQLAFGVPHHGLQGHAFHTYTLRSADGSVCFSLQHNVVGRRIYAEGTVDAVLFLANQRRNRASKRLYNMIDVLEAGGM